MRPSLIKSIGLDIVEVSRIKSNLDRYGQRFVKRVLSQRECDIFNQRKDGPIFLAGRFAAKEAVVKGLGVYLSNRPPFNRIQIVNDSSGRPRLELPDAIAEKIDGSQCLISITHDRHYAAAVAIFEEDK
jgi:holo-[acyl-carrier-protein] synthase